MTDEERDRTFFATRLCADGALTMAGLSYRIGFENRRLLRVVTALAVVNACLSIALCWAILA